MATTHELRALLAPIPGSHVLVPGSVVAEVVTYSEPDAFRDAPDWLRGELQWSGWRIPVINLAILAGTSADSAVSQRHRILVLKTLTEAASVLHVGIIINGVPTFKTLSMANIAEKGASTARGIFSHVEVDGQRAIIPDLDELALAIEELVYRNA